MTEKNHGVIPGSGTKNLYVGGTIPYEVVNESGDWRPFVVKHEKQKAPFETMACVSFSCNNCIEIQYNFYGEEPNFSDRFLAKMSDTTPQGNYLDKVADTARKTGVVREDEWPNPGTSAWAEYYKEIPEDVKKKAIPQPIQYEPVTINKANIKKHLKQSPIQITIPAPHANHAVTLLHVDGDDAYTQDHYGYQIKKIPFSQISTALKIVLTKPNMFTVKKVKVIIDNKPAWGVAVITPNMINISLAEDEEEWRSYSKSNPGYGILSVNPDTTTNWDVESVINL